LIRSFSNWLEKDQPEPLAYDLGEKTGRRELVLCTGGLIETFRVFFHALTGSLLALPARILLYRLSLPEHLRTFDGLQLTDLPLSEADALAAIDEILLRQDARPTFLVLGAMVQEETRRHLRQRATDTPLFIVEANDAPNGASMAREARLSRRVLRFLTPGVLRPTLASLPTVFVAGAPEYVAAIEVSHFQLKGTPSAPEVEHLAAILQTEPSSPDMGHAVEHRSVTGPMVVLPHQWSTNGYATVLEDLVADSAQRVEKTATAYMSRMTDRAGDIAAKALRKIARRSPPADLFAELDYGELYDQFLAEGQTPEWQEALRSSFLGAFLQHRPEYDPSACAVASGSSRTALGLIGFHCGITDVVTPDLSWTYEHCFPRVTAVPLTEDLQLDVDAILAELAHNIDRDPAWTEHGALALNNPHNATGQAFRSEDVRRLLQWTLEHGIYVLDDLAYQDVGPRNSLQGPPTLRQIAYALVRDGYLTQRDADRLVVIQSVSKTDSLAGSRLAVVEIRDRVLRERFTAVNQTVAPNVGAMFLSYLFYRSDRHDLDAYWTLRNRVFEERMTAIEEAVAAVPVERNRFAISVRRPTGSMYPLMRIERLPFGVSLDWLSSGLARRGIGLLPLSAFARTEKGFETGRKAFRLTLGGTDGAGQLAIKTRRVVIDLNRMMAEEESRYNRRTLPVRPSPPIARYDHQMVLDRFEQLARGVRDQANAMMVEGRNRIVPFPLSSEGAPAGEILEYIDRRIDEYRQRTRDRALRMRHLIADADRDDGKSLARRLEEEFYKDNLQSRQEKFRRRLYDRTVHPTQMYSLKAEALWEGVIDELVDITNDFRPGSRPLAGALIEEYAGLNVAITSREEGEEIVLDLKALLAAEDLLDGESDYEPFISYWGDWDGSTRPSGQGHQLVAAVVLENVRQMAALLNMLLALEPSLPVERGLRIELASLVQNMAGFRRLMDEITALTNQLEKRYRGILPVQMTAGPIRKLGMHLHLASDPLRSLWQHNDRLERRMVNLRQRRKEGLVYYFSLNKLLRKTLHAAIPSITGNLHSLRFAMSAASYRDLLKRIVITPRIHQKLLSSQDQFAVDTTVHNITEINEISGSCGNPGMLLALQVSMATSADTLISLDRKLRASRGSALRRAGNSDVAPVWLIPLFEEMETVNKATEYLGKVWEYAVQSRRLDQDARSRFSEIVAEIFIAGSDLSQQTGQTTGAQLFREAKLAIVSWLAERDLVGSVRIKMGSGEPMQRQGGYYAPVSGLPAFTLSDGNIRRLAASLPAAAKKSAEYATTPLMGVFASGDLRTFQSNISEQLRYMPVHSYANLLLHVHEAQRFYERELKRATEPLVDTRLQFSTRGQQDLERLTLGRRDTVFDEFTKLTTENFRHIVYGKPEDVAGIHLISYFIARTTPPLRDRPTVRPGRNVGEGEGRQILERIAGTIPLSKYGSLLRAIAHNQAQTAVLGINQLTTGLFRALHLFASKQFREGTGASLLADRVFPELPVYEILHTLRLYHDPELPHLRSMEFAFPAGNSALSALREDVDAMPEFLGQLKKELVRRHGLNVADFFEGDTFLPDLLPTMRPDLAVLLQPDIFNTEIDSLGVRIGGRIDEEWLGEMRSLLAVPAAIRSWRSKAWTLLHTPVYARVQGFIELALALFSLSPAGSKSTSAFTSRLPKKVRASLIGQPDDSMQEFLSAALEFLTELSHQQIEVPTTVVRALHEVERILRIEEQALSERQQEELRFYILQIARLAGENG
ncbi:MAG TPA: pyridoxal phosphate-dependent aminotransferase, partial [Bacteroidota bacterium]|nr:pyridoxal phosphate-dependent aminotransferase [Bacteroidota bacterium]